jgi:Domain of unknown function (DUF5710)
MTKHLYLSVPYTERTLARALGARWCPQARLWYCTTTQYRSRGFRRWRDKSRWRRIIIYPDGAELREAKMRGCLWDGVQRSWYLEVTGEDALQAWHRARLMPPPTQVLRVTYEEREVAKKHGARWDATLRRWVVRSHTPLSAWLVQRLA